MPKTHCNHCPIVEFCNRSPILVDRPTGKYVGKGDQRKPVTVKARLCPLVLAVNHVIEASIEP